MAGKRPPASALCLYEPVEIVEFGRLSDAHRADLEGEEIDPFDAAGVTLRYRAKERHVALHDEHERLIASAGLVATDVEVDARRIPVVGLGGVIVERGHRGEGHARTVIAAALASAAQTGRDHMMLFCHADRAGLYERFGFVSLDDAVTVLQPGGDARMLHHTMVRPLAQGATWPPGPVRVLGLPF